MQGGKLLPEEAPETGIRGPLGDPFQYEQLPFIIGGAGNGEWNAEDARAGKKVETASLGGEQSGVFCRIVELAEPAVVILRSYLKGFIDGAAADRLNAE